MISVKAVEKQEKQLLWDLLQKYLHELSQYYGDQADEKGNFPYRYFPLYFTDDDRSAYFIYDDEEMIGFALINSYSMTDEKIDNCIAEFTIFPARRNKGKGLEALDALRNCRSGKWQLKYSILNKPAERFWTVVKERYGGSEFSISECERVVEFV